MSEPLVVEATRDLLLILKMEKVGMYFVIFLLLVAGVTMITLITALLISEQDNIKYPTHPAFKLTLFFVSIIVGWYAVQRTNQKARFEEQAYLKYKGQELEINNENLTCTNLVLDMHTRRDLFAEKLDALVLPWSEIRKLEIYYSSADGRMDVYTFTTKSNEEIHVCRKSFVHKEKEIIAALHKVLQCPLGTKDKEVFEEISNFN